MNILQGNLQGFSLCFVAVLGLTYSGYNVRKLARSLTTWRDGVLLARGAVLFGLVVFWLALLAIHGSGLLTVLSYNRNMLVVRDVFANLHSSPIDQARAAALLQQVGQFDLVSRSNLTPAPPEVTEGNLAGTSLDQALWLVARLDNSAVRLVVGEDPEHAWVEWTDPQGVAWIFDPARWNPVAKSSVLIGRYLPRLVWTRAGLVLPVNQPTQ